MDNRFSGRVTSLLFNGADSRALVRDAKSGGEMTVVLPQTGEFSDLVAGPMCGRAYFKEALPVSTSFSEAFETARELVTEWEADHDTFSDPQIWSPDPIREHLAKWWRQQGRISEPRVATIER